MFPPHSAPSRAPQAVPLGLVRSRGAEATAAAGPLYTYTYNYTYTSIYLYIISLLYIVPLGLVRSRGGRTSATDHEAPGGPYIYIYIYIAIIAIDSYCCTTCTPVSTQAKRSDRDTIAINE